MKKTIFKSMFGDPINSFLTLEFSAIFLLAVDFWFVRLLLLDIFIAIICVVQFVHMPYIILYLERDKIKKLNKK